MFLFYCKNKEALQPKVKLVFSASLCLQLSFPILLPIYLSLSFSFTPLLNVFPSLALGMDISAIKIMQLLLY